ncbi:DUF4398 domain-containing protein [Azospirillum doebereinerae]|uniref:DUF4398 domain-containing protein n=1 Tax=Azospirillum doebereinerae TaxID=92933 RepID=UPI0023683096|nr:DUF4398 domain-containing protein [Azospirillum doebereinerae]
MNPSLLTTRGWPVAAALSAALGLAACATDVPPPTAQLGASSQAVAAAERANALQYAPVELQSARDKLAAADAAMRADERTKARHLAEQAQVDAELATARSQRAVTQQAAVAVQKQAIPRTSPQSAMTPPPATPSLTAPSTTIAPPLSGGTVPMNNGTSWGSTYTYTPGTYPGAQP